MNFPPSLTSMKPFLKNMVIFTSERITPEQRKACTDAGFHVYDVRQSDEGGEPASIEASVFVNHYGTLICEEPIKFPDDYSYYPLSRRERNQLMALV